MSECVSEVAVMACGDEAEHREGHSPPEPCERVCARERERVCVCKRERVCVCVWERERGCVCVCACERERDSVCARTPTPD